MNRADCGNTIFTSGGGKLEKLIQATDTVAKVWSSQEIKLSTPSRQQLLSFNSYTTVIYVANADDVPVRGIKLSISAKARKPVYINGLYYVLGKSPVTVKTDAMGSVMITEVTEDINSAVFTVSTDNGLTKTDISPMDKSFQKLATLDSESALRGATLPVGIIAGGIVGSPQSAPLIASTTPGEDVAAVATNLSKLKTAYSDLGTPNTITQAAPQVQRVVPVTLFLASRSLSTFGHDIAVAAGDIFCWLKSGVSAVINVIKDIASGTWHFFASIAGKVYRAVLATVDAIVGAVEWVFKAIKTGVEDIIHFLEFLFDWDDIRRTKDVMHNVVTLYLQDKVADLGRARIAFDQHISEVEQKLNNWAGITDWSSLGAVAANPAASSTSNPAKGQTSGSQLLASHFRNHASDLSIVGNEPTLDVVQNLANDLLTALSNEGAVLSTVYTQLQNLATRFHSMTVGEALKQIAIILVDGVLSSVQVVVDALLDVLHNLASSAIGFLDTKIHIPIISGILNAIGISDISFLDLFTWIAAVGYTVVYKIAKDEAPFPDNENVKAIISATNWDTLAAIFANKPLSRSRLSTLSLPITLSSNTQEMIFISGHAIAGFISFIGDLVNTFEAEAETGTNPFSTMSAIIGIIGAASGGVADTLAPKFPVENTAVGAISKATTAIVIVSKPLFSSPVQGKLGASSSMFSKLAVNDGRATSAIVNSVLVIPALFVSGWHFYVRT